MSKSSHKVIGIDEVGTGSWAGPAYVCAVAVDDSWLLTGLKDSKELTKPKIAELYGVLVNELKVPFTIETVSVEAINEYGLGESVAEAWSQAGRRMQTQFPDARVFLDGARLPPGCGESWLAIPNADAHVPCVMAAAIIAKYLRDQYMIEQAKTYPQYGWDTNVGYGTLGHREALNTYGVTPLHRTSFRPVQQYMAGPHKKFGAQDVSMSLYEGWTREKALDKS